MNPSELKHDRASILAALKKINPGKYVAVKDCHILIPRRYVESELAYVGSEVFTVGNFAVVVDDKYATVSLCAMMQLTPTTISRIKIQNVDFYDFWFRKGSVVISNTKLVKTDTIPYLQFDDFFSKGRVPWFMPYEQQGIIFDTARKHAGANVGEFSETVELLASLIAKDPKNLNIPYRHAVRTYEDVKKMKPAYVGLNNPRYAATDTMNRLGGAHAFDGIGAALLYQSEDPGNIEVLLRQ